MDKSWEASGIYMLICRVNDKKYMICSQSVV